MMTPRIFLGRQSMKELFLVLLQVIHQVTVLLIVQLLMVVVMTQMHLAARGQGNKGKEKLQMNLWKK